jgi:hypothetical protein
VMNFPESSQRVLLLTDLLVSRASYRYRHWVIPVLTMFLGVESSLGRGQRCHLWLWARCWVAWQWWWCRC